MQSMIRPAVMVIVILLAGFGLASVPLVSDVNVWRWDLGSLVEFAALVAATLVVADLAARVRAQEAMADAPVAARELAVILLIPVIAVGTYLACTRVISPSLAGYLRGAFAGAIILVTGVFLWRLYQRFDELSQLVARRATSERPHQSAHAERADVGDTGPRMAKLAPSRSEAAAPSPTAPPQTAGAESSTSGYVCGGCGANVPSDQRFCGQCGSPIGPGA